MRVIPLRVAAAALTALALGAPAAAQTRPLQTEEARTAPAGTVVLEVGAAWIADEPNLRTGAPRDRLDLGQLNVVYSPADNVELDIGWTARIVAFDDPDFGTGSDSGDVSLRAKVRFDDPHDDGPAIAARFGMDLPQTEFTEGLGPNTIRMSAQMLLSATLAGLDVHLNAGLAIEDEATLGPPAQSDFLHYGAAIGRRVGDGLELLAEVSGKLGDGFGATSERGEVRAGARFGRGALRVDAAVRRGLLDADGEWGFTAGLRWRLADGS